MLSATVESCVSICLCGGRLGSSRGKGCFQFPTIEVGKDTERSTAGASSRWGSLERVEARKFWESRKYFLHEKFPLISPYIYNAGPNS